MCLILINVIGLENTTMIQICGDNKNECIIDGLLLIPNIFLLVAGYHIYRITNRKSLNIWGGENIRWIILIILFGINILIFLEGILDNIRLSLSSAHLIIGSLLQLISTAFLMIVCHFASKNKKIIFKLLILIYSIILWLMKISKLCILFYNGLNIKHARVLFYIIDIVLQFIFISTILTKNQVKAFLYHLRKKNYLSFYLKLTILSFKSLQI